MKQLHLSPEPVRLLVCNPASPPLVMMEGLVLEIFGVVTNVVYSPKQGHCKYIIRSTVNFPGCCQIDGIGLLTDDKM